MVDTSEVVDLYTAVTNNSLEHVTRYLEDSGVDIEMKHGLKENTPLFQAASLYFTDNTIATMLLDKGADPFAQNKHGDTALGMAAFWGNLELVKAMIGSRNKLTHLTRNRNGCDAHRQAEYMGYVCNDDPVKLPRIQAIMEILAPYQIQNETGGADDYELDDP